MIHVTCIKCGQQLELEDVFAGSVARCRYCTALVNVPQEVPRGHVDRPAIPVPPDAQRNTRPTTPPLPKSKPAPPPSSKQKEAVPPKLPKHIYRAVLLVVTTAALAAGMIAILLMDQKSVESIDEATPPPLTSVEPSEVTGAALFNLALRGKIVAYCLDSGRGSNAVFDIMRAATLRSIASLQQDQKFLLYCWSDKTPYEFQSRPEPHNETIVNEAAGWLAEIVATGASDPIAVVDAALLAEADVLCLMTGKPIESAQLHAISKLNLTGAVIHTVALENRDAAAPLERLATENDGRSTFLTISQAIQWLDK